MEKLKEYQIGLSEIPIKYLEKVPMIPDNMADDKEFQFLSLVEKSVREFVYKKGLNLLICSNKVGNGKTTWATRIGLSYIENYSQNYMRDCPVLFLNVPSFLVTKKLSISNNELLDYVNSVEDKIHKADLVIFDDIICDKKVSEYDLDLLYSWIEYRTSTQKSCIYTSNVLPDDIEKELGSRLSSRILNYCYKKVILTGEDHRKCL